jgi:altronate hydrolase
MSKKYLQLHSHDNVLVALQDLEKGLTVDFNGNVLTLKEDIPAKHKFYLNAMQPGDEVIMYGVLVGKIQTPVNEVDLMTVNNLKHAA